MAMQKPGRVAEQQYCELGFTHEYNINEYLILYSYTHKHYVGCTQVLYMYQPDRRISLQVFIKVCLHCTLNPD